VDERVTIPPPDVLTGRVLNTLHDLGYDFYAGVPCSWLQALIRVLDADPRYDYVSAAREDAAIGMATGAYLAGRQPVVLMQNSGLGVALGALVSLGRLYGVEMLILVSWRGEDGRDAPEHLEMGAITQQLLRLIETRFAVLDADQVEVQLADLTRHMRERGEPVALVVGRGAFDR